MAEAENCKRVAHIDCPGGGQVWVDGTTLFVGHMRPPHGTSLYDVSDPRQPRHLASIEMPAGWHSHKVRAENGVMLVNHERFGGDGDAGFGGGLGIYDVSRPDRPQLIANWRNGTAKAFTATILRRRPLRLYLADRRGLCRQHRDDPRPGRSGQARGGRALVDPGPVDGRRRGLSLGRLDAAALPSSPCGSATGFTSATGITASSSSTSADMSGQPKAVAAVNTSPVFPHPTHTCLAMPWPLKERRILVVADEDVAKLWPAAPAFTWVYDITNEALPTAISTFQVDGLDPDGAPQPAMTGCHQPSERIAGTVLPFAWFAAGLRLVDIARSLPSAGGRPLPAGPAGRRGARLLQRRYPG